MDPRIALDLGIVKIHWYGIIVTTGMVLAVWIAMREFKRRGMNPNIVSDGAVWVIGLGIVGARLYHVFSSPNDGSGSGWQFYRDNPLQIFATWNGGLGIWGGIVGGILGIIYVMWRNKVVLFRAFDAIVPGVLLGQTVGRWANFVNQELYGGPTGSDWFGLLIDPQYRIRTGQFDFTDLNKFPPGTRFHPTFLYESIWNLAGFLLLMWLARNKQENPANRADEKPVFLSVVTSPPPAAPKPEPAPAGGDILDTPMGSEAEGSKAVFLPVVVNTPAPPPAREDGEADPLDAAMGETVPPADAPRTAEAAGTVPARSAPARSMLGTLWPMGTHPLRDGDIGPLFLVWYGFGRAIIEMLFRPDAWTLGALPTAVWVSIAMIAAASVMLALNRRKRVSTA
jgi:phosphatidylglycerol:prolipoprotein diacylglycerol transferase